MKKAKEDGNSNFASRFIGGSVGIITALPIALSATVLSTALSPTNKFTNAVSDVYGGLTVGQAKDGDKEIRETIDLADALQNVNDPAVESALKAAFGDASSTGTITPVPVDAPAFKTLKTILNSKLVANSLPSILKMVNAPTVAGGKVPTFSGTGTDVAPTVVAEPLVKDAAQKDKIANALKGQFPNSGPDDIKAFLTSINVFG